MFNVGDKVTVVTNDALNGLYGTVKDVYRDAGAYQVVLYESGLRTFFYYNELRKAEG